VIEDLSDQQSFNPLKEYLIQEGTDYHKDDTKRVSFLLPLAYHKLSLVVETSRIEVTVHIRAAHVDISSELLDVRTTPSSKWLEIIEIILSIIVGIPQWIA